MSVKATHFHFITRSFCSLFLILIFILNSCSFTSSGINVFEPLSDDKEIVIVAEHPANLRRTEQWPSDLLKLVEHINSLTEEEITRYRQFTDVYDGEQCTDFLFVDAVTQNGLLTKSIWLYIMQDNICLVRVTESEYANDGTFLRDTENTVFTHTNEEINRMILDLIDSYSDRS